GLERRRLLVEEAPARPRDHEVLLREPLRGEHLRDRGGLSQPRPSRQPFLRHHLPPAITTSPARPGALRSLGARVRIPPLPGLAPPLTPPVPLLDAAGRLLELIPGLAVALHPDVVGHVDPVEVHELERPHRVPEALLDRD